MLKKLAISVLVIIAGVLSGCASAPMAPSSQDTALKKFEVPQDGKAGVYIYRNSFIGQALKKNLYIDGQILGKTANKVYFYKPVEPGEHTISTESEFSDNQQKFTAEASKNYFFEQYIKLGLFVGGANVKIVNEAEGKLGVSQCKLAISQ